MDKITHIAFNPVAKDILLTVSIDRNNTGIRIWDLSTKEEKLHFEHGDMVFDAAWKPDGSQFATTSKSKKVKVFDARNFNLIAEGPGHNSIRPAKLLWLGDIGILATVGFGLGSAREVLVYKVDNLTNGPYIKKNIDISPSVMNAQYDPDCGVLYVAGRVSFSKGDGHISQTNNVTHCVLIRAIELSIPLNLKRTHLLPLRSTIPAACSKVLRFCRNDIAV